MGGGPGLAQRIAILLAVGLAACALSVACSCEEEPSAASNGAASDASPDGSSDAALDAGDSGSDAASDASLDAADDAMDAALDSGDASSPAWTLDDPGANGFQFVTPEFDVPAGSESARCYFFRPPQLNPGAAIWIDHVKMALNAGSHELTVYQLKTVVNLGPAAGSEVVDGECFKATNFADWPVVVNTQHGGTVDPITDWQLPSGVALALNTDDYLMLRVHYVNDAAQATPNGGRAGINFYYSAATNPIAVGVVHPSQQSLRVCQASPSSTVAGHCTIAGGGTVIAVNGQLESRGTDLEVFAWSGDASAPPSNADRFYQSTSFSDPPMALALSTALAAQGGFYYSCVHAWSAPVAPHSCADVNAIDRLDAGDCCYAYGQRAQTSERCDVYLYYYPKATDVSCQ